MELPSDDHDEDSLQDESGPIFPSLDSSLTPRSLVDTSLTEMSSQNLSSDGNSIAAKYSCSRCGRSYLHQATLVRHQRYECGISASYPCQLCGRKFKRRDVLKGHMEKCMNKSSGSSPNVSSVPSMVSMPSIAGISSLASAMAMNPLPHQH